MTKEFIPYEEALALKELGFDEPCFGYFRKDSKKLFLCDFEINNDFIRIHNYKVIAPLYQQAFRWLFEKRGIKGCMMLEDPIDDVLRANIELVKKIK